MSIPDVAGEGGVLSPADDLPVHQVAQPIAVVGTTDRHFYDRYYFCAHHSDGSVAIVGGLGQYPNLGVTDAFLSVTWPDHQEVLRCSRELDADRLDLRVGPISVAVESGLRVLHFEAEPNETGIEAELTWTSATPAYLEPRHVNTNGTRVTTESARFCQAGRWSGHLAVDDRRWAIDDDRWLGIRDRSWGLRPVGEPEPVGRRYGRGHAGCLWLSSVLKFSAHMIVAIVQEDAVGRRSLDHAARVDLDGSITYLGPVSHELEFRPGTREVHAAHLRFDGGPDLQVDPMTASYLALGTGYGTEPDWRHGMYQGPLAVQRCSFDLTDVVTRRMAYGLVDSIVAASVPASGARGFGLFEYAVLGGNERYGFGPRTKRDGSDG